jgi:hypothetical protein
MFSANKWATELYRVIQAYWHIQFFLTNQDAISEYIKIHKAPQPINPDDSNSQLTTKDALEALIDEQKHENPHMIIMTEREIAENLQESINIYNRQMVVLIATLIEQVIRDFLKAAFIAHPERMYTFLIDDGGHHGMVSLKLITKAKSLTDLINELSDQATYNAMKGRFEIQLNNITNVVKAAVVPDEIKTQLIETMEMRNRIVHEASHEDITQDDLHNIFDTCIELLVFFNATANKNGIPIDVA